MKKNLLTVLLMVLLIVNIVLTSITMYSVIGTNSKTAALVTNIAAVMNLERIETSGGSLSLVPLEDTVVYNIADSMTIPLKVEEDGSGAKYILFNIAFSLNTKHTDYKTYGEDIDAKASLIKDVVTSTVSVHTESECRDDFDGLKTEILKAVQGLFQSDFIFGVSINDVKYA